MGTGGDLPDRVSDEIRRYLTQYPDAADTDDGIQRWWLPPWCQVPIDVVRAALERLMAEGFVTADEVVGGRVIYRRSTT
jgi:hypothetical protein